MKLPAVITPRGGQRFVAVLVMCCAILAHISAMEDALDGQRSEGEQNFNGVSADGADPGKLKQFLMQRERRSANNATPTLSVIEKRLEAMEDRWAFLVPQSIHLEISIHVLYIYIIELCSKIFK